MKRICCSIGVLLVISGFAAPAVAAPETTVSPKLSEDAAMRKFDRLVVGYHRHLTGRSPSRVACERMSPDSFSCTGRWKANAIKYGTGVRTRFIYSAEGGVTRDPDAVRAWAQLTRWEIADGVKRGPFRGAHLKATFDD